MNALIGFFMSFIKGILYTVIFQICLLTVGNKSIAQESMLTDFSYLYMEKLVAIAKENYPKSVTFENRMNIAKNNVNIARASWLDPFNFVYVNRSNIYAVDGVNPSILSGYFFNITLSPVSLLVKRPFQIKNAKEELSSAIADRDEYSLLLETEVKKRYIAYLQSHNNLKLISKRLVDAEANYTYLKTRYERSEISFREFNDASIMYTTTQESKIGAEANYFASKFALEELLTIKLEDIK